MIKKTLLCPNDFKKHFYVQMIKKTVKCSHRFSSQLSCREVHWMVDDRDSVFGGIAPRSASPVEIELVVLKKVQVIAFLITIIILH